MLDQIMIPPVASNGTDTAAASTNPFRKSMEAGTSTAPDPTATKPSQSSLSPLLAQIGIDPATGIETTISLFAFSAENEDELSFPANELIRIVEKDQEYNDGWYRGKNQKGEEGLFPASYVLPTGADPKPYLEMQQAPQPLNLGGGSKAGTPNNVVDPESSGLGPTGLGIGGVTTSGSDEAPRPASPTKSLARRSVASLRSVDSGAVQIPPVENTSSREEPNGMGDSLVETKEQASKGEVQGPHAQASELVSPAERAAAKIDDDDSDVHTGVATGTAATGLVAGVAGLVIASGNRESEKDKEELRRNDRDATPMPEDGDRTITETDELDKGSSVGHGDDATLDDEEMITNGNNNIRARLAEQARLENEKKERKLADELEAEREAEARKRAASDASIGFAGPRASAGNASAEAAPGDMPRRPSNGGQRVSGVRMSGGVPHGLVYSDESDSDDEGSVAGGLGSPKRGNASRRLGWEEEDEKASKGFGGFARFGAFGSSKPAEPARLEQIQEKDKVDSNSVSGTRAGLEPSAPIVAPIPVRPAEPQVSELVESAPVEYANRVPAESTPKAFVPPFAADSREQSPMGTPIVQLNDDRFQSPPAPMFRRQSSGLSNHSRETPVVAAIPKSISPVPQQQQQQQQPSQPVLTRKYSEEMAPPRSGAVTPKDVSRLSEAGSGFSGGNPHEWGVTEVVEWARSRGFDDAICEKFAEHEITGDVLLELDANLLKELEIPQFGKRIKIANAIADLRRPQSTMSMGNASNRSSTGLARGPSMTQMGAFGGAASPTVLAGGYPASPTYGNETGSRSASIGGIHHTIPEDQPMEAESPRLQESGDLFMAGARPQSQPQTSRSGSGTPASGNYNEWAHSRKSSISTSLVNAPIREEDESGKRDYRPPSVHQSITPDAPTSGMLPPVDAHHRSNSIRSIASSIPSSPQTPNTKRNSTEQRALFGHKKAKSSLDGVRPPSERMSFFGGTIGRNRKPAPRYPSNASTATFSRDDPTTSPTGPDRQKSLSRLVGGGSTTTNRITKSSIGPATAPVHGNQRVSMGTAAPATVSGSPTAPARRASGAAAPNESSAMSKIGKPDFAGYMKKKGERYNTWKSRYFVLKGAHLYYMKGPQEDKAKGHIDLAGYKVLSDPNAGSGFGFQLVHDREKTHFFASNEHRVIKDWMKNLMKATISRDYSAPVVSSCNIPTIPLREAQMLAPRPPSPGQREAAQRAARRDDPNKLTPRDASVLMSLEGSPTAGRRTTLSPAMAPPGRPSRDMRRPSEGRVSTTRRPSEGNSAPVAPIQPPIVAPSAQLSDSAGLLDWFNARLPFDLPERATSLSTSFADGKLVTRLIETYCHPESSSAIPAEENIFQPVAPGEPNLEGLFTMMDKCIDEGVDTVGVSINDVRLGHEDETRRLLVSLKGWIEQREREGR